MRISDWSSDVCSSDLIAGVAFTEVEQVAHHLAFERREIALGVGAGLAFMLVDHLLEPGSKRLVGLVAEQERAQASPYPAAIGGRGTRSVGHWSSSLVWKSVVYGKSGAVRVDLRG